MMDWRDYVPPEKRPKFLEEEQRYTAQESALYYAEDDPEMLCYYQAKILAKRFEFLAKWILKVLEAKND